MCFFFFQAEDGIRDGHVTGVQTCALPIYGAWDKLVGAGILTLPDASEVKCNVVMIDGMVFIIETNFKWHYRTYAYANPQEEKCNEAKQMISIIQIIHDEFALE